VEKATKRVRRLVSNPWIGHPNQRNECEKSLIHDHGKKKKRGMTTIVFFMYLISDHFSGFFFSSPFYSMVNLFVRVPRFHFTIYQKYPLSQHPLLERVTGASGDMSAFFFSFTESRLNAKQFCYFYLHNPEFNTHTHVCTQVW
jgi:hypothetical protein